MMKFESLPVGPLVRTVGVLTRVPRLERVEKAFSEIPAAKSRGKRAGIRKFHQGQRGAECGALCHAVQR